MIQKHGRKRNKFVENIKTDRVYRVIFRKTYVNYEIVFVIQNKARETAKSG